MSDYKRLVAYIYLYDRGNRVKNIGFAKTEVKNRECRIQIHVKGAWMAEQICCRAYLFYRAGEKLRGIFIGEFTPKGGAGELKMVTSADDIMDSGLKFGQMAGILILTEGNSILATRWDDGPVSFENFSPHEKGEKPEGQERPMNVLQAAQAEEKREQPKLEEEKLRKQKEDLRRQEEERIQQKIRQMRQEERPDVRVQAAEELWEHLKKGKERLQPFGKEVGGEYISVEPAELLAFPESGRYLVNNSFLLHGFYNYGHLLLGVQKEDGALMLGIPGEFYVQEKVMAQLFGFPEFRKTVDCYGNQENLGYWLRKLEETGRQ